MKDSYYDSPFTIQRLENEPELHVYNLGPECICGQMYQNAYGRSAGNAAPDELERIEAAVEKAVKAELIKMREAASRSADRRRRRRR